jgi:spore germination cell wall hydrolase CwlJ-like protein
MISTVRAAALAVAAFAFAGAALWGGPVRASGAENEAPSISYVDHASASVAAFNRDLGMNDDAVAVPQPRSLDALVAEQAAADPAGPEQDCLASAVYFEARSEPLQGQLAVAEVVLNRAASGQYPTTLCGVVVQRSQFSFVRRGRIPRADRASDAWRRAVAIARIAKERMMPRVLPETCLWYHARYVSPSWGRRLAQSARIGLHIFYS